MQCCKAHNEDHFCQKDETSISLRSKVRNRAKLTFQLALKWHKVANGWILQIWLFSTLPSPQTTRRERFDEVLFLDTQLTYFLLMWLGGRRHCGRQEQQEGEDQGGR